MAVTYSKIERIDATAFRLRFTSDRTPPVSFRVFFQGRLISSITSSGSQGEVVLSVPVGDNPFVEVLDKPCSLPTIAFPGRVTLNWLSVTGASSYRVEELVSGTWTLRQTLLSHGGTAYTWGSRWLEDSTTHQFRVIPVDSGGNQGTALSFSFLMVRHPDTPDVRYEYNQGSQTITIAEGTAA